jgi:Putative sterol carrier protein
MSDVEDRLRQALPRLGRLGAVVAFDLGADGRWLVDARTTQPVLEEGGEEGDGDGAFEPACTIRLSGDNLLKLMDGRLDPMLGYTLGKIKVAGSLGVAMKLVNAMG